MAVDRLFPEKLGHEPMDDEADPYLLSAAGREMAGRPGSGEWLHPKRG